MRSSYNETWVYNLAVIKEAKRWHSQTMIDDDQLARIRHEYASSLYHPNLIIRILLFIATLLALSGVTGFFTLFIVELGEDAVATGCVLYGIASFFFLEKVFIESNKHYKSGVNEALLYHACGFTIGGFAGATDFNPHVMLFTSMIVFAFAAIRYLDLITTVCAVLALAGVIFYEFYIMKGIFQQIIPFLFILFFTPMYFLVKKAAKNSRFSIWTNNLIVVESLSLLLIYAAGNYMVVRELSVNLMQLDLAPGQNIPFAFLFYCLTVIIPLMYLFWGIRNKDIVLLRVSLFVLAFSVFTFKYYFSLGHPEITLTIAGAILLVIALALLNYLRIVRNGFTRENHLPEKWGDMNMQAMIISQTLGGNQPVAVDDQFKGGGGEFGGGGASGNF